MPRIRDDIMESVVFLYSSREAAEAGESWGGCGFFVGYPMSIPLEPPMYHIYLVSNQHVVATGNSHIRLNVTGGDTEVVSTLSVVLTYRARVARRRMTRREGRPSPPWHPLLSTELA